MPVLDLPDEEEEGELSLPGEEEEEEDSDEESEDEDNTDEEEALLEALSDSSSSEAEAVSASEAEEAESGEEEEEEEDSHAFPAEEERWDDEDEGAESIARAEMEAVLRATRRRAARLRTPSPSPKRACVRPETATQRRIQRGWKVLDDHLRRQEHLDSVHRLVYQLVGKEPQACWGVLACEYNGRNRRGDQTVEDYQAHAYSPLRLYKRQLHVLWHRRSVVRLHRGDVLEFTTKITFAPKLKLGEVRVLGSVWTWWCWRSLLLGRPAARPEATPAVVRFRLDPLFDAHLVPLISSFVWEREDDGCVRVFHATEVRLPFYRRLEEETHFLGYTHES